ncbi:MAG: nitroreductase family protein [Desulfobacterales bacterium]
MFFDLIAKRRSIRRFTGAAIEPAKIEYLREAALRAPSSRGLNHWEFVFVTERGLLTTLSSAKAHGSSFLADAALGIVVCADPAKSDVWVEDAAIATTYIQLAAEALDLGSCWIQIRKRMHDESTSAGAYIADTLGIPAHLAVEAIAALGHPAEKKAPHKREALLFEKVFLNRYGASF